MSAAAAAPPSVVQALAAVMADVQAVRKSQRNADQGYVFRGIDGVMNAVGPALRKHGVVILPVVEQVEHRDVQTSRGKPARECTVRVRYVVHGPAGDTVEGVAAGEAMDWGDKGTPKALSVAFRTFLLQALCIPTDEPDPDGQAYERDQDQPGTGSTTTTAPGPDLASAGLQRTLGIELGKYGLGRREDRLTFCSGIVGRELVSSAELTTSEGRQILATVRAEMATSKVADPAGNKVVEETAPAAPGDA